MVSLLYVHLSDWRKKKDSFFEGSLRLSFEKLHLRIGKTSVTEIRILKYKIQLHLGFPL